MSARIVVALVLLLCVGVAQDKAFMPFYGNAKCPIEGKDVNRKLFAEHEAQRIHVCSKDCRKKVDADLAANLAKAYPADKVVDVKNATCPCMPKAAKAEFSTVWQGHKVQFCCKKCLGRFPKQPARFLTMALNKDLVAVGNTKCPVMPEEDVEADMFILYKGKLIDLCCDSCVDDFDAAKHMKNLPAQKAPGQPGGTGGAPGTGTGGG
ncbi:MAG: hypothetical protein EXS14_05715 [Planctomycetes bacterium]|nr:hypothetical protein [Planctomycetota bacterium]